MAYLKHDHNLSSFKKSWLYNRIQFTSQITSLYQWMGIFQISKQQRYSFPLCKSLMKFILLFLAMNYLFIVLEIILLKVQIRHMENKLTWVAYQTVKREAESNQKKSTACSSSVKELKVDIVSLQIRICYQHLITDGGMQKYKGNYRTSILPQK